MPLRVCLARAVRSLWPLSLLPVCCAQPSLTTLDPVPQLLSGPRVTTNVNTLATKGVPVVAASSDGVTEVVLRISGCSSGAALTITVLNAGGHPSHSTGDDGGLFAIGGSPSDAVSSIAISCQSTQTGNFAFAIYLAPLDFNVPGSGREGDSSRPISFDLTGKDGHLTQGFQILRPPVLFVHGMWGSPSSWSDFCNQPVGGSCPAPLGAPFTAYVADYSATNGAGFLTNAKKVFAQQQKFLLDFKSTNQAAAVQFDAVGHSMGGLVARTIVGSLASYLRAANFDSGDFHKVITVDAPHLGSPLARNLENSDPVCILLFDSFGYTVAGAIADLAPGSHALQLLKNKVFPINAHLISGVADAGQAQSALNNYESLLALACPNLIPPGGFQQLFGGPNDLIVGLASEQGAGTGYSGNTLPVTAEQGLVHTMAANLITLGPSALNQNIVNGNVVWAQTPNPQAVADQLNAWIESASFGRMLP